MPNLATAIKEEIRRLAKREIKVDTTPTKGAVAQFRRDLARMKRELRAQAKEIAFLKAQERKRLGQPQPVEEDELEGVRFSARSAKAQRERLGLSQQAYAKLVGVSPMTIYNWESGNSRPRNEQLAALVAVRGIGKREAMAKLDAIKTEKRAIKKTRRKPR
jgi:DNA-binding transcriptional regulator YiaG